MLPHQILAIAMLVLYIGGFIVIGVGASFFLHTPKEPWFHLVAATMVFLGSAPMLVLSITSSNETSTASQVMAGIFFGITPVGALIIVIFAVLELHKQRRKRQEVEMNTLAEG